MCFLFVSFKCSCYVERIIQLHTHPANQTPVLRKVIRQKLTKCSSRELCELGDLCEFCGVKSSVSAVVCLVGEAPMRLVCSSRDWSERKQGQWERPGKLTSSWFH